MIVSQKNGGGELIGAIGRNAVKEIVTEGRSSRTKLKHVVTRDWEEKTRNKHERRVHFTLMRKILQARKKHLKSKRAFHNNRGDCLKCFIRKLYMGSVKPWCGDVSGRNEKLMHYDSFHVRLQ